MVIQRIYIAWVHPLFRETVSLLLNHQAVEIVGTSNLMENALADIDRLQPDTVIVEETEGNGEPHVEALQILKACPWKLRVIRMSLQDNELWVYHHQRRSLSSSEEFLRIIQED